MADLESEDTVGYFVAGEEVVEVKGYDESIRRSRRYNEDKTDNEDFLDSQVFWTREGAEDAIKRLDPATQTDPITGSVMG